MTEVARSAGGVRLVGSHLHFGHYVGTFAAAAADGAARTLYYLIKDTEPFGWRDTKEKQECIEGLTREALAIAPSDLQVKVVLVSRCLRDAWRVANLINDNVNLSALVTAHFDKASIRNRTYAGTMRNFLFPLDEATALTFLSVNRFYSNIDNQRVIRFVRDVQRKLIDRAVVARKLLLTELIHFPNIPFLPGADHRRMRTQGGNVLPVLADDASIGVFCDHSVNLGRYFDEYPSELARFKDEGPLHFVPEERFAPFAMMRALAGAAQLDAMKKRFTMERKRRTELAEELRSVICEQVARWRNRADSLRKDDWNVDRVVANSDGLGAEASRDWSHEL